MRSLAGLSAEPFALACSGLPAGLVVLPSVVIPFAAWQQLGHHQRRPGPVLEAYVVP